MDSLWSESDARALVDAYGRQGHNEDLALRVYTTRLLGGVPSLVVHGGGNTSLKTKARDLLGDEMEVICVKGSGWDMATIEPPGLPAVRLSPLRALRRLDTLSDEEMVNVQRSNLLDSQSPNPSVETLLHAFLPHRYIDHTHTTAVLSLTNQPNGEEICRSVYGDRVAYVPYVMPGFALAKLAAEVYEAAPGVEGMVLLKHGLFSFGDTARDAYERMIRLVDLAEQHIGRSRAAVPTSVPVAATAPVAAVAPLLRGALAVRDDGQAPRRWVLEHRAGPAVMDFVNGADVARYAQAGVATPDHVIRTKGKPLLLPMPDASDLGGFADAARSALAAYADGYRRYFETHNRRVGGIKTPLDPLPRVVVVPGLGLFAAGASKGQATVVADVAETWVDAVSGAERIGRFESISEADLFDMEYWSLEQAKLGKAAERPLARQIAVVTGGAGAIGLATARAMAAQGAEVALLDLDPERAREAAKAVGGYALGLGCDVTDPAAVRGAFDAICAAFGGIDIVVSNAGAAWQGEIGEVEDAILRQSFELNFFAHQTVAQNAVRVFKAQATGGALLFNASKQAINPGDRFGPYGLPKAATLLLCRQYALEYGALGIRANAVNADRIRSGLLTDSMITSRAAARGVSVGDYMAGNLLHQEVTAEDVAQAFVHHAVARKTTADVTTVDGGNIAAILR